MADTSGRNVVLTGAAGGMGRAITKALLESGRRVVLVDRDPDPLRQFAAEMGNNTFPLQLDITDSATVDRLPDLLPEAFKPVDVLINNAGHDIGGRTRFDLGAPDPADIARSIVFALHQLPHVQIAEMMILPVNRY